MRNLLIVISGPSGVGKGTIVNELLSRGDYKLSVSCTTRMPRNGEEEGKSYFFISKEKFLEMIDEGGFLEYSNHFASYYGTPKSFVESQLQLHDVILEIDVDGGLQVKKAHPEALLIMILPPDKNALRERLKGRGSETDAAIERRLARMDYEVEKSKFYDYTVINEDLNAAVKEIENIIKYEKE